MIVDNACMQLVRLRLQLAPPTQPNVLRETACIGSLLNTSYMIADVSRAPTVRVG